MVAQGAVHLTEDVDVCYARDDSNLTALVEALAPYHPTLRGAPPDLPFRFDARTLRSGCNFTFETALGNLDLLGQVSGLGDYDETLAASEKLQLYGVDCPVLTVEGLIRAKQATGRKKDELHLAELKALLELRRRQNSG